MTGMHWRKLGRVFVSQGQHGWINSHAQVPTALVLPELDLIRVYFAPRPREGFSLTTFLDVSIDDPTRVIHIHDKPIFEPGPRGSFDEHGVMPQCALRNGSEVWLYYAGWSRRESIPYSNWMGLAVSRDLGKSFHRAFAGPVLDRTRDEIFSGTGLFVLPAEGGGFQGWYATGTGWSEVNGRLEERYLMTSARSVDGIEWQRDGKPILDQKHELECTTRPTVCRMGGEWHMWYCYRKMIDFRDGANAYRIGYARSPDTLRWERLDEMVGIEPSVDGWDAKMLAYPYVVHDGRRYLMFYNGNGFGATGFGVAELVMS